MNTIFEFIASPENVAGFLWFLLAAFLLFVWGLICEIQDFLMLERWRKAEKLRRMLDAKCV